MTTQKKELQYAVKQYLKIMMTAILSGIVLLNGLAFIFGL
tara:strand:+ start:221 stop:340 length:120 start_codon:yes stop_codon:yes gene_type:complete